MLVGTDAQLKCVKWASLIATLTQTSIIVLKLRHNIANKLLPSMKKDIEKIFIQSFEIQEFPARGFHLSKSSKETLFWWEQMHKWRHSANTIITKHNFPKAPNEGKMRNLQWQNKHHIWKLPITNKEEMQERHRLGTVSNPLDPVPT